ncbi:TenA family protein [Pseudonocardia phyllosphaerae]|uniref:TenA family protein n=1 Tax=Pseudonocardia phyllosphaerae TaxID=3390502 RepID=UPI00397973D2
MTASGSGFSADWRGACDSVWRSAVTHRFVDELWAGAVDRGVLRHYLEQDHEFVDAFLALLGAAVAHADDPAARVRLAQQLGLVAGPENDFFTRSLAALGSTGLRARAAPTTGFLDLMAEARDDGYAEALAVLVVAEWLYADWAARDADAPADPVCREWIDLHRGPEFTAWVEFLRAELDRVAAGLDEERRARVAAMFVRAVNLELAFFDAAYAPV